MSNDCPEDGAAGAASAEQRRQEAVSRSNCYGLLALVLRDVPTVKVVKQLGAPAFVKALSRLGYDIAQDLAGEPDEVRGRLSGQYVRTFVGPGPHVSLFASVHHSGEGQLWGPSTVWVKRFIEHTGISFAGNWESIPDHLGIELELMQRLAAYEADLWAGNEPGASDKVPFDKRLDQCLRMQEQFLREHLCIWVPQFCRCVLKASDSVFYRKMAKLAKSLVVSDLEQVTTTRCWLQDVVMSMS